VKWQNEILKFGSWQKKYYYDEAKHAGETVHKQYVSQMIKYEFDLEFMGEQLGFEKLNFKECHDFLPHKH
jgi:hypothetical protein